MAFQSSYMPPPRLIQKPARPVVAREFWRVKEPDLLESVAALPSSIIRAKTVVGRVAEKHGVAVNDIMGASVRKIHIAARHEAILAVRSVNPDWGTSRLGRFFGRDHSTIWHVLKKAGVA